MSTTSIRGAGPTPAKLDGVSGRREPESREPREPRAGSTADQERSSDRPSPMGWVLVALIRSYQRWISPALAPRCRFYPSCSAYAVTAIQRFGAVRGSLLAAWRLLKCQPFHPGGIDHVPARPGRE